MSGIFGLIQFGEAALLPEDVALMRGAMSRWGRDGVRVWSDASAALGQCVVISTPEARFERLPEIDEAAGFVFTAAGRLDNRDELIGRLALGRRPDVSDGALMRRAVAAWGQQAPERMLGDWAFAAWYRRERRLLLARDQSGRTSLYTFTDGRRFAFASDRRAILALPAVSRELDELYLAQVIMRWPAFHGSRTVHACVGRVPPAHAVEVTERAVREWQYSALDVPDEQPAVSTGEYVERLRELLTNAVACRLRSAGPVGSMLSGGLDSGSVTVLAARLLGARGERLSSFTGVPVGDFARFIRARDIGDEGPLASQVAQMAGNIDHYLVGAEETSPLAGMHRMLDIHGEIVLNVANYYWMNAIYERARQGGIVTLLCGETGNLTISDPGTTEQRAPGWVESAVRRALRAVRRIGSPSEQVRRRWGRSWTHPSEPWLGLSPMAAAFSRRLRLAERLTDERALPQHEMRRRFLLQYSIGGFITAEAAAESGIDIRDPTSDYRVVRFTVQVSPDVARGPMRRWPIRQAMKGLLPDAVRLNTAGGIQAADLVTRLRSQRKEIEEALVTCEAVPLVHEYLDVSRMRRAFARVLSVDDVWSTRLASEVVLRGLGIGFFLKKLN